MSSICIVNTDCVAQSLKYITTKDLHNTVQLSPYAIATKQLQKSFSFIETEGLSITQYLHRFGTTIFKTQKNAGLKAEKLKRLNYIG